MKENSLDYSYGTNLNEMYIEFDEKANDKKIWRRKNSNEIRNDYIWNENK